MQASFWWWQCSERYMISLLPHLHTPSPRFSPSLISLTVSVDDKYHVYCLLTVVYFTGNLKQEVITFCCCLVLNETYFIYKQYINNRTVGPCNKQSYLYCNYFYKITYVVLFVDIVCRCDRCLFHITIMSDEKNPQQKQKLDSFISSKQRS